MSPNRHNRESRHRTRHMPGGHWLALLALVAHLFQAAHFATPHEYDSEGRLVCSGGHAHSYSAHSHSGDSDHADHRHPGAPVAGLPSDGDSDGGDPDESPSDPADHAHECPFQLPGLSDGSLAIGPGSESLARSAWVTGGAELEAHRLARLQLAPKHGPPTGT